MKCSVFTHASRQTYLYRTYAESTKHTNTCAKRLHSLCRPLTHILMQNVKYTNIQRVFFFQTGKHSTTKKKRKCIYYYNRMLSTIHICRLVGCGCVRSFMNKSNKYTERKKNATPTTTTATTQIQIKLILFAKSFPFIKILIIFFHMKEKFIYTIADKRTYIIQAKSLSPLPTQK